MANKTVKDKLNPLLRKQKINKSSSRALPDGSQFTESPYQFPVVGIGASAGGLDAFKKLLKSIPENSGMAFVLVQHLHPGHESMLADILQKVTKIPVLEISDDIKVIPDHIYIIPSNKMLVANNDVLLLSPRPPLGGRGARGEVTLPVDVFFSSLAEVHQAHSIGVVLSGTASDGTLGLKAIKDYGGMTFAQEEASAAYEGMPHSAIQAGVVDYILPPEKIAGKIIELTKITHGNGNAGEAMAPQTEDSFKQILSLLRVRKGMDFTYYKQATIRRRILRRIALNKTKEPAAYLKYLRENKPEQDVLFQDLLIPVTSFFRDPKSFENICATVLPEILKNKRALSGAGLETIRIWVAGCSTGEEVYSIAICLKEVLGNRQDRVQLFATDISEPAIAKARTGLYSKADVASLSGEHLNKFFTKGVGGYQLNKQIREMCVFAVHNFLKDPPFTKMDLISCRNVLIYMEPRLQNKALTTFHYALNPKGYLLLGKSETISSVPGLFVSAVKHDKLFTRKDVPGKFIPTLTRSNERNFISPDAGEKTGPYIWGHTVPIDIGIQKTADDIMLSKYTPAGVVVNEAMDIVHFRGKTGNYLEQTTGQPSHNIIKLAKIGLAFELRNLLHKAKKENATVSRENIPITSNGDIRNISIEAIPLPDLEELHYLVLFHEKESVSSMQLAVSSKKFTVGSKQLAKQKTDDKDLRIAQLEKELSQAREDMRSITEDQESANEELQSANEELESSSEELQSLNEELETGKEEQESTNEELTVLNQELISINEQATEAREFSEAIISNLHEPLVVLNKSLRVVMANDTFYKTFQVNEGETEDRLIYDLGNRQWNIPELRRLLEQIIPEKSKFQGLEVSHTFQTIGLRNMVLNAREIIRESQGEKMILLAIEDITERVQLEKNKILLSNIVDSSQDAIISKTLDGIITTWNKGAEKIFGYTPTDAIGKHISMLIPPELLHEEEMIIDHIKKGQPVQHYETLRLARNGKKINISISVSPIKDKDGKIQGASKIARDITEQVENRQKIKESEERFRSLADESPMFIFIVEPDAVATASYWNKTWLDYTGQSFEQAKGRAWDGIIHPDDVPVVLKFYTPAFENRQSYFIPAVRVLRHDGEYRWHSFKGNPRYLLNGEFNGYIGVGFDVHEQKIASDALKESEAFNRTVLESSPDCVKNIDTEGRLQFMNTNGMRIMEIDDFAPFKNKAWPDLWGEENKQTVRDAIAKAVEGNTAQFQAFCATVKGTPKWWDVIVSPVKSPGSDKVNSMIAVSRDLTEQLQTAKIIEENEKRYHNLIYSSPSAIGILHGEDLVITIANDAIIEIWGKGKEIMGKPYFEALPELDDQGYREIFHQVYKTGKPFNAVETPINILHNGKMELKYFNLLLQAQRNINGEIDGIGIIATEVTSQALFNNKIKESEEQFSTLSENMENLAWLADGDGWIYWYNKRWYDYTGTTLEEMQGWGWQKVHHPDHVDRVVNFVKEAWHKNEAFELTFPLRGDDGKYKWFLTRAFPIADEQGKVMRWIGTNTNIDEQKKAETEIKYRKALLEAHNESSLDGILLTNDKGKIISFNKRYIEIWNMPKAVSDGMNDEAIIAHTLSQLLNKEELIEKNKYIYEHPLEAGSILLSFKDGKIVERHNYPVMGEDGSFYGVSLTYRDITEQKSAQVLLEYRKALLEAHNESSVDGILLVDAKGKIISYNHRFIEIWNMPPHIADTKDDEAALAHAMTQLVHPEQFIEKVQWLYEHPTEICSDTLEFKDGKIVERHGYPVVSEDGSYYAWSWTFRDITGIKKAENILRQSEENFRQLAELIPDKITTADAEGNTNYYNQNWFDYTGLTSEQLLKEGWVMLMHPDDIEEINNRWRHCMETGNDFEMEFRIRNKTGNYKWHLSRASAVKDKDGKITKWISTSTEIHGQKEQREKLEKAVLERTRELQQANATLGNKNEELISLNKELESFAYVSSHDLQEPLRKIQTFGSYIADREKQNLSSSAQAYFNKMQEAATRMRNLIDDLLAYSRTNSRDRKFETINLNYVIDDVINDLKETIEEKNATLKVGGMCAASIIPFQFQQLFTNLIGNSLKFSIPGKPPNITITSEIGAGAELNNKNPELIAHKLLLKKQYCHISIADNGIGFDPEFKERIFSVFQRLHGKDEYPGTGIGLAIVKKIVENHNGIITATGEINKGARFDIYIPSSA